MTRPQRPITRGDLTVVELDGEAVVYDGDSGDLHHLNATATLVFSLCDGTATAGDLAHEIAAAFHEPVDAVERHLRRLLREFRRKGLLVSAVEAAV